MFKILLGDLQIQISKNGLQLKLKLHEIWRTELWQEKQWFLHSDQLVFLKMMSLFGLERAVPPLVITFELAYQSCYRRFDWQIRDKVKVHLAL